MKNDFKKHFVSLFQNTMWLNGWGAISLGFIGLVFVVTLGKMINLFTLFSEETFCL